MQSLKILSLSFLTLLMLIFAFWYGALQYAHAPAYPLDDTYIHLAIAKNLALHHVWAPSGNAFASASSSVLYTLLLAACIKLFSTTLWLPFILNLVSAFLLLWSIQKWLQKQGLDELAQFFVLLAVIILTPLPVMVIGGMEHTMQCLVCFLFVFNFCGWLGARKQSAEKLPWTIYVYGALVTATRYEGVFLIAIACAFLLYYRKLWLSISLGVIAASPGLIFGVYSLTQGGYFIPNSVLVKSTQDPLSTGLWGFFTRTIWFKLFEDSNWMNTIATQRLLLILPILYVLFIRRPHLRPSSPSLRGAAPKQSPASTEAISRYILLFLFIATILHLCFATIIRYPRYEAYLVCLTVVFTGFMIGKSATAILKEKDKAFKWAGVIVAILLVMPLFSRARLGFEMAKQASINIHEQQVQMGRFVEKYYKRTPLVYNDIGAVSYASEVNNIDLLGLGTLEIAKARLHPQTYTPALLDSLIQERKAKIAIIYEIWFPPDFYAHWTKVATWQISDNVICGSEVVTFFAIDKSNAPGLKQALLGFQKSLPPGVNVAYYYD